MVQGTSFDYGSSKMSVPSASSWEKTAAKRSGYEAMQRLEKERQQKSLEDKKYGAWGSTFKNKEHFANMHHC